MKYSGQTTSHSHIVRSFSGEENIDWSTVKCDGRNALEQHTILHTQWSNLPVEVEEEVQKLWQWQELGNDNYYFKWSRNEEHSVWGEDDDAPQPREYLEQHGEKDGEDYSIALRLLFPIIDEYLMNNNVEECLIHWWW